MIKAFQENKDIYATIASLAFRVPYEECLEFNPITHDYQPEGKARRTQAKSIVLGITYGRSTVTIGQQLFGSNDDMSDDDKTKEAERIYDAVLNAFPSLKEFMNYAQSYARKFGYTETILGRRRHIPDMQLPRFEFTPMNGYVNPDIDPLDVATLENESNIPDRVVHRLENEFNGFKYYSQIVKRTKELQKEKIKVINNTRRITDATRQCVNCVDLDTEILTTSGWKTYNEISDVDSILAYDLNKQLIVEDYIEQIHIYEGDFDVVNFKSSTLDAVSTFDHRWVCKREGEEAPEFVTTRDIEIGGDLDYSILRCADNNMRCSCKYSDIELEFIACLFAAGIYKINPYYALISLPTFTYEQIEKYRHVIKMFHDLGLKFNNTGTHYMYNDIYIEECDFIKHVTESLSNEYSIYALINSLDQYRAGILMRSILKYQSLPQEDSYICEDAKKVDMFQYLAFIAGYASNISKQRVDNKDYYVLDIIKDNQCELHAENLNRSKVPYVWCVTSGTGTWVARRHGSVFITGNSIIQGSAADLTKMAILKLDSNERWHQIGGRLLVPVHDELICEVPQNHWEEGRDILKSSMETAGSFLPFSISCDIEVTKRWYGLSFPVKYSKPSSFSINELYNMDKDYVKWIQYNLVEAEYVLPVIADENAPIGDEARGINGIVTDEMISDIKNYIYRFGIDESMFIDHIDNLVQGKE